MRMRRIVSLLLLSSLGSAQSSAPAPEVLLREGDALSDGATVTGVPPHLFEVADGGHWAALAYTATNATLVVDDQVVVRTGEAVPGDPSLSWLMVRKVDVNENGRALWNGFAWGDLDSDGVYEPGDGEPSPWIIALDDALVLQSGDVSLAPALPGAVYQELRDVAWSGSRRFLMHTVVLDPAVGATVDALVEVEISSSGHRISERLRHKSRAVLPGQTAPIENIASVEYATVLSPDFGIAVDDLGGVLYSAVTNEPRDLIVLEDVVLAEEGGASPVPGRNWMGLYARELDVDNQGGTVFRGRLDGEPATSQVVVKDGAVFRQAGDPVHPGTTDTILRFHQGSLSLADNGDLLWYTEWNDGIGGDNLGDGGFLVNDELLIEEGVTRVEGDLVWELNGFSHSGRLSDDARWVLANVHVFDGATNLETLVRLDRGPRAVASRRNDLGLNALCLASDRPLVGATWTYTIDSTGSGAGLEGLVVKADATAGLALPAGELLVSGAKYLAIFGAAGGGQNSYAMAVPNDASLIGVEASAQTWLLGPGGLSLCNALDLTVSDR